MTASPSPVSPDADATAHVHKVVAASGTSFLQGMRLLPAPRREGMFAVYAFCREIDDIADEPAPLADKHARLAEWRREIGRLYEGGAPQMPTGRALLPIIRAYGLRREDFIALIDGMEMDAVEDIRAPSMEKLELYCDRVAGAVGRLSVRVFGATEPEADIVARRLGQALQLTNILRDLREDAGHGRLYLPRELLVAQGINGTEPNAVLAHPGLPAVCAAIAAKAREHYAAARAAMRRCARKPMRPAGAMADLYNGVLDLLEKRGWTDLDTPVKLSKWRKIGIALRYALV